MDVLTLALAPILGLFGVTVGAVLTSRREYTKWRRDQRLQSYVSVLEYVDELVIDEEDEHVLWDTALSLSRASSRARIIGNAHVAMGLNFIIDYALELNSDEETDQLTKVNRFMFLYQHVMPGIVNRMKKDVNPVRWYSLEPRWEATSTEYDHFKDLPGEKPSTPQAKQ